MAARTLHVDAGLHQSSPSVVAETTGGIPMADIESLDWTRP